MSENITSDVVLWRSRERQCANFVFYAVCAAVCALMLSLKVSTSNRTADVIIIGVPLAAAAWRWLQTYCHIYTLTGERLLEQSGVIIKKKESLELYRVTDITAHSTLVQTIFRCGQVIILSSDSTHSRMLINAVPEHMALLETIRDAAEKCRVARGVRFYDF